MDELLRDPQLSFHVGRLTGASEMLSHWLTLRDDPEEKAMGERIGKVVDWFFVTENV